MASSRLSIRITSELQHSLQAISKRTGKTESEIVREAIELFCRQHASGPSVYDLMAKAGWVGSVDDAPSDLSTNPAHLEGFGA